MNKFSSLVLINNIKQLIKNDKKQIVEYNSSTKYLWECSKVDMETEGRLRGLLSDLKGIELQTEGVRGASVDVWAARR